MTEEDKKIIADYMGWWSENFYISPSNPSMLAYCRERIDDIEPYYIVAFDLNDAGLCVQEMQKRGDWEHNFMDFVVGSQKWNYHQCFAWLFNAENFFNAMSQLLKERHEQS